jgi:hypothetical protein
VPTAFVPVWSYVRSAAAETSANTNTNTPRSVLCYYRTGVGTGGHDAVHSRVSCPAYNDALGDADADYSVFVFAFAALAGGEWETVQE